MKQSFKSRKIDRTVFYECPMPNKILQRPILDHLVYRDRRLSKNCRERGRLAEEKMKNKTRGEGDKEKKRERRGR